jgi:hypothetical protein
LHATPHVPPLHVADPFAGAAQTVPHAPQLFGSVLSASHTPPQSVKPASQVMPHVPPLHVADPFAGAAQTVPHAPQLFGSFERLKQLDPHSV